MKFSVAYLIKILSPLFDIRNVSYIDERGDLFTEAPITKENIDTNFGCNYYGCGIFELTKKK